MNKGHALQRAQGMECIGRMREEGNDAKTVVKYKAYFEKIYLKYF